MAVSVTRLPLARPEPFQRVVGHGRGTVTRIVLTAEAALAPCLEGQATAAEAETAFERIINAALANNRGAVVNLAQTGQYRAAKARAEFARMAAELDGPDAAA